MSTVALCLHYRVCVRACAWVPLQCFSFHTAINVTHLCWLKEPLTVFHCQFELNKSSLLLLSLSWSLFWCTVVFFRLESVTFTNLLNAWPG